MPGKRKGASAESGSKTVIVNPKIYPLDVVYSAAYVFLDRFYVLLDGDPGKEIRVVMTPKAGTAAGNVEKEFHNQLVNYAFYKRQSERSSDIRKAIMQRALATTELAADPVPEGPEPDADYVDDPEGIAVPWEEKFGKKKGGGGD